MKKKNIILLGALILSMGLEGTGSCRSLSIDEAVETALRQNQDISIVRLEKAMALGELKEKRGANSLIWKLSSSFSGRDVDLNGWNSTNSNSVSASLPIYSGGSKEANIKSSELGLDIADMNLLRQGELIKRDVLKAYYDALEAQKSLEVYKDKVDKYKAHLTNVEQLYDAGSKAKIEVLRSQVELSDAEQMMIKGQCEYENNLNSLKRLLNISQAEALELTDDVSYLPLAVAEDKCLEYALENRLDLRAKEYELEQKRLALTVARSSYLPSVDLTLRAGWEDKLYPTEENHEYSGSIGISWNIFDGGISEGKSLAAKASVEKSEIELEKAKKDIELDLGKNLNSLREAEKRFISTGDAIKKAEEDFFIANEKYKAGEGIMLDIIDAQEALSTARKNYISAQYDYARSRAAVECDLGIAISWPEA